MKPHRCRARINPSYSPGGVNVHLPSNTWLLGLTRICTPNGTWIVSAVFVRFANLSKDRQTDRQTDRPRHICSNKPHPALVRSAAMRPKRITGHCTSETDNTETARLQLSAEFLCVCQDAQPSRTNVHFTLRVRFDKSFALGRLPWAASALPPAPAGA